MREFNEARPHQGKRCFGETPMQTYLDALPLAREKSLQVAAAEQHTAAWPSTASHYRPSGQ